MRFVWALLLAVIVVGPVHAGVVAAATEMKAFAEKECQRRMVDPAVERERESCAARMPATSVSADCSAQVVIAGQQCQAATAQAVEQERQKVRDNLIPQCQANKAAAVEQQRNTDYLLVLIAAIVCGAGGFFLGRKSGHKAA